MDLFIKNRKRFIFITSLFLSAIVIILGGVKLMIYILLLISGLIAGSRFEKLMQVYRDYKTSLRVNSIITSSKQYEEQQHEIERLRNDLRTASDRMGIYNAAQRGVNHSGNFHSNGTPWARENQ